jgi:hypothetical protein
MEKKQDDEPRYAGNTVCPICGRTILSSDFSSRNACRFCMSEVISRWFFLRDAMADARMQQCIPSRDVYIYDMLDRMKNG